jgi:hypothetical protein
MFQIWDTTVAVSLIDTDFSPWTRVNLLDTLIDANTLGLGIKCLASRAWCTLVRFAWVGWAFWAVTWLTSEATSKVDASLAIGACVTAVSALVLIDTLESLTICVRNAPETGAAVNANT